MIDKKEPVCRASTFMLATCLVWSFLTVPAMADKTDVVILVNGNAVTGELKTLDFGSLKYSTDSMGTVQIDWEDIVSFSSTQSLQVESVDGTRYFGSVRPGNENFRITVMTASGPIDLPMRGVVRIVPIETDENFWQRLDGSLAFGFNTQKSSEVSTLNLAFDTQYRTLTYLLGMSVNSSVTDQPSEETSARQNAGFNYQRFRDNRWFTEWFLQWESNDELGIDSRVLVGGAIGRYLIQTNLHQFSVTGGLNATRENFVGGTEDETNAEGRLQIKYLHRNLAPESSLSFTTNVYPLLEDLSSYRAETDLSFRREVIEDLFLDVTLYRSYLSDPPEGAVSTDYGLTTSLGYSF
jgi:putative salt-induced outer membrane protein YdiY